MLLFRCRNSRVAICLRICSHLDTKAPLPSALKAGTYEKPVAVVVSPLIAFDFILGIILLIVGLLILAPMVQESLR